MISAADPGFAELKRYLIDITGLAYYADRDPELLARIARRMSEARVATCHAYLRLLEDGSAELDNLTAELTVGETYFFRQPEQFEALARIVLPDLLERNAASRRLRIWSAGCATGAEPYSVAILLHREFGGRIAGWDIGILGTDINRRFLAQAAEAGFDEWAFRGSSEKLRQSCFRQRGKLWELARTYRDGVSFRHHNLVRDEFPSAELGGLDLVLCRNVMIYFSREVARGIVNRFAASLADGGWLLVGPAEPNADLFRGFEAVAGCGETLYRKAGAAGALPQPAAEIPVQHTPVPELPPLPPLPPPEPLPAGRRPETANLDLIRGLADRGCWEEAIAHCRELLEREPLNAAAHYFEGLVLEHAGHPGEAQHAFRRAVYLDRDFALAHYHLGLALQRADPERARRSFENVLEVAARLDGKVLCPHGDGITVAELGEFARLHVEGCA